MWLIFPSSPFSCGSGRFLLASGDKCSIFLHPILYSAKSLDSPTPQNIRFNELPKIIEVGWKDLLKQVLELHFSTEFWENTDSKVPGNGWNRGTARSMLLKPKVKWLRCFINSEFQFFFVYFPSPKCHKFSFLSRTQCYLGLV